MTGSAPAPYPPRERLVYTAVQHLRGHGIAGTGLRRVVADAQAPWGSLQHYFPGGKDQLITEALTWAGNFAAARVESYVASTPRPTPAGLFEHTATAWIDELERRDFSRGCPVVSAVVDGSADNETIRRASSKALETWRRAMVSALLTMDATGERAEELSTLMLCTLEGAIILARARRSTGPLYTVIDTLTPALTVDR